MLHRVLVCVNDAGLRGLICLALTEAGYTVAGMTVGTWLAEDACADRPADIIILDGWPLRPPASTLGVQRRLSMKRLTLILLTDGPLTLALIEPLGAAAHLPLPFTVDALLAAVHQASSPSGVLLPS
jgi:DNA-binding response OmpR family regulator